MSCLRTILLVSLMASACTHSTPENCPATGCPEAKGTMRLVSGSITFANGDAPRTSVATVSNSEAAPGTCVVYGLTSDVFSNEFVNGVGPYLHCNTGHGWVYASFPKLTDPRQLTVGAHPVETLLELAECDETGCAICHPVEHEVVTLTVEEATGAAAPYPKLATADLKRTFRIDLSLPTGAASAPAGARACTRTVSLEASLRFEQTAADWTYDASGRCMPCE